MNERKAIETRDANRDPITGEPGAHPVGVGVGTAAGGAAAGALARAVGGPVGAAVGAVVGGVAGGLAGKATAEKIDPTAQDAYWRENYSKRPYYAKDVAYDTYAPAYRHGWESQAKYPGKTLDEVETQLNADWDKTPAAKTLLWEKAKPAVRDARSRIEELNR
jgi:phage tail tape-measure protein